MFVSFTITDQMLLIINSKTVTVKPGVVLVELDETGIIQWATGMEGDINTNDMKLFDSSI